MVHFCVTYILYLFHLLNKILTIGRLPSSLLTGMNNAQYSGFEWLYQIVFTLDALCIGQQQQKELTVNVRYLLRSIREL